MDAVERLLQRAADVQRLFDEMLGPMPASRNPPLLCNIAKALHRFATVRRVDPTFVSEIVAPPYRPVMSAERCRLWGRWASEDALGVAAHRAVEELARPGRKRPPNPYAVALEHYFGFLERREEVLSADSVRAVLSDVVREALAWGPLSTRVVRTSESLAGAIAGLRSREINTREGWRAYNEQRFEPAVESLRPYARPPSRTGSTSGEKATKKTTERSRAGVGGRKRKYSDKLVRDVVRARLQAESHARRDRSPVPAFATWLSDYCSDNGIDVRAVFPSIKAGDKWPERAHRFWKAARKRMRGDSQR